MQHANAKQPVRRLWLQSMTPAAIRESFCQLRADAEMMPLADAARCRSEADWLVGINGTRAMTAFKAKGGGFFLTTVGRVQTPTLAIVVEREEKILAHVARDYWEVRATFGARPGPYDGRWFDRFQKRDDNPDARAERLWTAPAPTRSSLPAAAASARSAKRAKPSSQLSPLCLT